MAAFLTKIHEREREQGVFSNEPNECQGQGTIAEQPPEISTEHASEGARIAVEGTDDTINLERLMGECPSPGVLFIDSI